MASESWVQYTMPVHVGFHNIALMFGTAKALRYPLSHAGSDVWYSQHSAVTPYHMLGQ